MTSENFRRNLLHELRLIASPSAQIAYEKELSDGPGWAPWELIEGFFDLYSPGNPMFDDAFTADERKGLSNFSKLLESTAKEIPDHSVLSMLEDPDWQQVIKAANELLRLTGEDRGQVESAN